MTMKITALYVYPIKALRGIKLELAHLGPQGVKHDRRFMLFRVQSPSGELKKLQLDAHPPCALFGQQIEDDSAVVVSYHGSLPADCTDEPLRVPLGPDISDLAKIEVNLHGSPTAAYRMGEPYDAWFSQRFGFPTALVYLGDGRRAVLGTSLLPKPEQKKPQGGWLAALTSYIRSDEAPAPWLSFTDVAPFMVASESSLRHVREHLLNGLPVEMYKFRPNVVVDGEGEEAWAEDYWAELAFTPGEAAADAEDASLDGNTLLLTGNCVRCTSLNVDYQTGAVAAGELGQVLKKLMKDRRVDPGSKWSPVFGRYAFLGGGAGEGFNVSVGDEVEVVKRNSERSVTDWPSM